MPKYILANKIVGQPSYELEEIEGVDIEQALYRHRALCDLASEFISRHYKKEEMKEYIVSLFVAKKADYKNEDDLILLKKSFVGGQ